MVWLVLWRNQGSPKSPKGYRLAVPALSRALDTGTAQVGLGHDFQSVGESDGALIGDTGCPFWIHALVLVNLVERLEDVDSFIDGFNDVFLRKQVLSCGGGDSVTHCGGFFEVELLCF